MAGLKITKRAVDAAPVPAAGDAYFWDQDLKGFGLRVTPKGVKSYVVQYRMKGMPARRVTIGQHGSPWTPEKARDHAQSLLIEVRQGRDPVLAARKRQRETVDLEFGAYIEAFTDGYLKIEWADSWADGKQQLVRHVLPHLKGRALPRIEKHEIAAAIDKLRSRPALARNTHAVVRKLFAWAVDRGDLKHSPVPGAPPAVKARKRIMSPDEIVAMWKASYGLGEQFGPFVRMLVVTLQRRSEVGEMPWAEVSEMHGMWRQAGERVKNEDDHLVPLSALAIAELDALAMGPAPEAGADKKPWKRKGFVFTTTGETPISGFSKAKARLDKLMLPILQKMADARADALGEERELAFLPPWRFHDIRRTGTTQMQALGIPIEVTEKVINHRSGETAGIRGVYNLHAYTDEKRKALDAWAGFLVDLIGAADAAPNVVPIARRA
ncbi:MAG TPA: integrase family protein [Sphingomonas sp.]|jgi:integrase|uniref:tyrosine-type recombinase/integrase n=1 Tax=Sphingomonas sp. TaxID=28214 RepID=UPI002EDB2218